MQIQHPTITYDLMTERRERYLQEVTHRQIVQAVQNESTHRTFSISAAIGHLLVTVGNRLERGRNRPTPVINPEATAFLAR
jgi:hypothetical protein